MVRCAMYIPRRKRHALLSAPRCAESQRRPNNLILRKWHQSFYKLNRRRNAAHAKPPTVRSAMPLGSGIKHSCVKYPWISMGTGPPSMCKLTCCGQKGISYMAITGIGPPVGSGMSGIRIGGLNSGPAAPSQSNWNRSSRQAGSRPEEAILQIRNGTHRLRCSVVAQHLPPGPTIAIRQT